MIDESGQGAISGRTCTPINRGGFIAVMGIGQRYCLVSIVRLRWITYHRRRRKICILTYCGNKAGLRKACAKRRNYSVL